jgi:glycosyltransferase involved in cell wall biosynthesis
MRLGAQGASTLPSQSVDLVMWTKNGADVLPRVLKRIENAIPPDRVKQKVVVDDHSTDSTVEVASAFNWQVHENPSTGISAGANEALRHVKSSYFVSVEQDLLLAEDWWSHVPAYLDAPEVAIASGMRFAQGPVGLQKLQQYVARKYRKEEDLASWLRGRQMAAFTLGKTLDNTIYKTRAIKALGGFPRTSCNVGVETLLAYGIEKAGCRWVVDYNVQSIHLRHGLKQELRHQQLYASSLPSVWRQLERETSLAPPITKSGVFSRLAISPATGIFIALKTREPSVAYIHPLLRLFYAKGLLEAG